MPAGFRRWQQAAPRLQLPVFTLLPFLVSKPLHLLKHVLLAAVVLAATSVAYAQPDCPKPVLKVLRDQVEVPATGSALASCATLQVQADPACPTPVRYAFGSAELTLVRRGRPVLPTRRATRPQVDLRALTAVAQPGDHLYIFIPYASLTILAADGQQRPYQQPQRPQPRHPSVDLSPDESKGISFNWLLTKD